MSPRLYQFAPESHTYVADVIDGLETFASAEIRRFGGHVTGVTRGVVKFAYAGQLNRLNHLRTVLSVYLAQHFDVPRPKALLGDQLLRKLLAQIDAAMAAAPRAAFHTFMLGAAGVHSPVMRRLAQAMARHTGLAETHESGELLVRLLPAPLRHSAQPRVARIAKQANGDEEGWDALVRISPKPLATRDWRVCLIEGALQATVAHVMAELTHPMPNDVHLNPCCGSGTLLIERALVGKAARLVGCDIDASALACAARNSANVTGGPSIELQAWNATTLPLPDSSVDAITADLPFGLHVGSHTINQTLYPAVLREAARVAKAGTRFVVITAEVKLLAGAISAVPQWSQRESFRVNLGGLTPAIAVLERCK